MSTLSPPPHHQPSVEHAGMDDAPGASLVTVVHKQLAALESLAAEGRAEAALLHAEVADLASHLMRTSTRLARLEATLASTERVLGAIRTGLLAMPSQQSEPQPLSNGLRQEAAATVSAPPVVAAPPAAPSPVAAAISQAPVSTTTEASTATTVAAPAPRTISAEAVTPPATTIPPPNAARTTGSVTPVVEQPRTAPTVAQREPDRDPLPRVPVGPSSNAPVPQPVVARAPAATTSATASPAAAPRSSAPTVSPSSLPIPPSRSAASPQPVVTSAAPLRPVAPPQPAAASPQTASASTLPIQERASSPAPHEQPVVVEPTVVDNRPRVQRGSTVEVVFDNEGTETYTIVRRDEASATRNLISENSPLGQALLGASLGDVVRYRVGNGPELVVRVGAIA